MAGSILIVDSVATNRIVLRVKLIAAQYQVFTATTCDEARKTIAEEKPDLMLLNMSDPTEDTHQFCTSIRAAYPMGELAIFAIGLADTNRARFAALDAGVDDVLTRPISDSLMLARIRGLLRRRRSDLDWCIKDETARAFGFDEAVAPMLTPAVVRFIPAEFDGSEAVSKMVMDASISSLKSTPRTQMLNSAADDRPADLCILEVTCRPNDTKVCQLVSDLKARQSSRRTNILALVPVGADSLAANLLDLVANDVAFQNIGPEELKIRVANLIRQKTRVNHKMEKIKNGLFAAITDPLTGLHNRRYAKVHLAKIAKEAGDAHKSYAVLVLDIDHFKKINDRYGHAAGDQVLTSVAGRLRKNFRAIDLVARIGGRSFLWACLTPLWRKQTWPPSGCGRLSTKRHLRLTTKPHQSALRSRLGSQSMITLGQMRCLLNVFLTWPTPPCLKRKWAAATRSPSAPASRKPPRYRSRRFDRPSSRSARARRSTSLIART